MACGESNSIILDAFSLHAVSYMHFPTGTQIQFMSIFRDFFISIFIIYFYCIWLFLLILFNLIFILFKLMVIFSKHWCEICNMRHFLYSTNIFNFLLFFLFFNVIHIFIPSCIKCCIDKVYRLSILVIYLMYQTGFLIYFCIFNSQIYSLGFWFWFILLVKVLTVIYKAS